jgi:hypothetical protein
VTPVAVTLMVVIVPDPAQTAVGVTGCVVITGIGFTVIEDVEAIEVHPFPVAVIVNVVDCTVGWVLVNVPVIGVPAPGDVIPVTFAVLLLVHEKVVPAMLLGLVISICVIGNPLQMLCDGGVTDTVGNSFTVKVLGGLEVTVHPWALPTITSNVAPFSEKAGLVTVSVPDVAVVLALYGATRGIIGLPFFLH